MFNELTSTLPFFQIILDINDGSIQGNFYALTAGKMNVKSNCFDVITAGKNIFLIDLHPVLPDLTLFSGDFFSQNV